MPVNISRITINAAPGRVWEVLTRPEKVMQWQFGSRLQTNWEPGGPIRFTTEWQGTVLEQWGTVLEVQPFQHIRYNLFAPGPGLADQPEHYFIMEYYLTAADEKTDLEIRQVDDRPGAVQQAPQGEENPVLQSLKKLAESN